MPNTTLISSQTSRNTVEISGKPLTSNATQVVHPLQTFANLFESNALPLDRGAVLWYRGLTLILLEWIDLEYLHQALLNRLLPRYHPTEEITIQKVIHWLLIQPINRAGLLP
jgi:hypothetical protein